MTTNGSTPDGETPAGDPELAALVRRHRQPDDADPSLAAADAPPRGEPTDTAPTDTSPTSEPGVDAVPVLPLAAAVTDGEPPARPRRRRSLALRFGVSFVLGFLLAAGIGAGALYAWGQQYDGRVLPGVRVGSTELGGLTREQAEAEIANAYGSLGTGQITLTGPDGQRRTSATPTSAAAPTPRRCSTRHSRLAARASPSRTSSAHPTPRSTA